MGRGRVRLAAGLLALCAGAVAPAVRAIGTPSGSTIQNVATLRYSQGGLALQVESNATRFRVEELLNVALVANDVGRVAVGSPDTRRVLAFTVTNTGNGPQAFRLVPDAGLGGDQFDPVVAKIALDSNGNHVYDATDADYVAGVNDPVIAPDRSLTVFLVCDIPADRRNGDLGLVALDAQAVVGTGAPGTVLAGHGAGGSDLLIGTSRGAAIAQAGYAVSRLQLQLTKSQVVFNANGATIPVPGSVVTYTLRFELAGVGNLVGGVIADPLPANTTYVPGSLKLDGVALGDTGDVGRFTGTAIEVRLGALTAPVDRAVTFQVRLN